MGALVADSLLKIRLLHVEIIKYQVIFLMVVA